MAAQFAVDLIFGLKGDGKIKQATSELKGVDGAAQKLNGTLRDSKGRFIGAGNAASGAANGVRKFGDSTNFAARAAGKLKGSLGGLLGGLGATLAAGKIVRDFADLDTSLRRLGTVGGDVKSLDAGLGALSSKLGGLANKADLAKASYQALSAGFTGTASNLQVVEAATKASVGGLEDVAGVTEVLTKTLNAYNMSGSDAVKVTDSISKAIEFGQVQWSDYTSQLGRAVSIAAVAGVSLNEVNAFIAASTKNGATAEIAFTGLGAALNSLLQPTKESMEAAEELGIQWNLAGLKTKGFPGLMAELAVAMQTNQEAAVRLLGSQESLRAVFSANAKGGKDYKEILEGLGGAAGKTQSDFDQMKGSLANQLKALDTEFKKVAEATKPLIAAAVKLLQLFGQLPDPVKTTALAIAGLGAAALVAAPGISAMLGLLGGITAAGLLAAAPWVAVAAGVTALGVAMYDGIGKAQEFQRVLKDTSGTSSELAAKMQGLQGRMEELGGEIERGGHRGRVAKERYDALKASLDNLQGTYKIRLEIEEVFNGGHLGQIKSSGYGRNENGLTYTVAGVTYDAKTGRPVAAKPKPFTPSAGSSGSSGSSKSGGGGSKVDQAAKEAEERAKRVAALGRELEFEQKLSTLTEKRLQAELEENQELVILLQGQERLLQIQKEIGEAKATIKDKTEQNAKLAVLEEQGNKAQLETKYQLLELEKQLAQTKADALAPVQEEIALLQAKLAGKEQEYLLQKQINDLVKAGQGQITTEQATGLINQKTELESQVSALDEQKQLWSDIYSTVSGQLQSSIKGLIDGTKEWGDVLSDILGSVGDMLLNAAFAGFGKSMGLPGFASGGSTPTNTPVLVGERGPELFVPGQSGGITNNQNLRSMMDSSGAKQNESSNAVTNLSFETVQIMDQQWIDRPQLEAAMAAASKRGAADGERRALDKLKQSPSTRRSLGL